MRFADSKTLLSFFLFLSAFALPACSSDDDPKSQTPELGVISIRSQATADGQFTYSINGSFAENFDVSSAECTTRTEGACTISKCKATGGDGGLEKYLPAGTLTVSGGLLAASGVVLQPDADNFYHKVESGKAWNPGQRISVKSSGAQVPAFEVSVSTPDTLTLEAPAVPAKDQAMSIKRSTGLELRWSGAKETKYVTLFTTDATGAGNPNVSVSCTFPANANTTSIPASALNELPAGETYLFASARNQATTLVNGKSVALHARAVARSRSGEPVQRNVTLE
ncbi:hypothetical protein LVJ94_33485 [Pendulispora rubella]|uniref:Lipoprotein n=1 Tax=Pendulispora rubella TaxID=2741070 RepID=A0ABZ2KT36_9BACT